MQSLKRGPEELEGNSLKKQRLYEEHEEHPSVDTLVAKLTVAVLGELAYYLDPKKVLQELARSKYRVTSDQRRVLEVMNRVSDNQISGLRYEARVARVSLKKMTFAEKLQCLYEDRFLWSDRVWTARLRERMVVLLKQQGVRHATEEEKRLFYSLVQKSQRTVVDPPGAESRVEDILQADDEVMVEEIESRVTQARKEDDQERPQTQAPEDVKLFDQMWCERMMQVDQEVREIRSCSDDDTFKLKVPQYCWMMRMLSGKRQVWTQEAEKRFTDWLFGLKGTLEEKERVIQRNVQSYAAWQMQVVCKVVEVKTEIMTSTTVDQKPQVVAVFPIIWSNVNVEQPPVMRCFSSIDWRQEKDFLEVTEFGRRAKLTLSVEERDKWESQELVKWRNTHVLYCPVLWSKLIWAEGEMPEKVLPPAMISFLSQREKVGFSVTPYRRYSWRQYVRYSRELMYCLEVQQIPFDIFGLIWTWVEGLMRELDQPVSVSTGLQKKLGRAMDDVAPMNAREKTIGQVPIAIFQMNNFMMEVVSDCASVSKLTYFSIPYGGSGWTIFLSEALPQGQKDRHSWFSSIVFEKIKGTGAISTRSNFASATMGTVWRLPSFVGVEMKGTSAWVNVIDSQTGSWFGSRLFRFTAPGKDIPPDIYFPYFQSPEEKRWSSLCEVELGKGELTFSIAQRWKYDNYGVRRREHALF